MENKYLTSFSRHTALQYVVFLVISIIYLFVASPYTSPSNPYYNCDSGIFYTIGNGINNGLLPYRDLFDHKGPLLFYIYALGALIINDKGGVFLLQALSLALSFLYIYKLCRLFLTNKETAFVILIIMSILPGCIGEGALSEEWSLPISLIPLYFVTQNLVTTPQITQLSNNRWLMLGVCTGLHSMIRLNNASITCGIVLFFITSLLCARRIRELLVALHVLILGVGIAVLPFAFYFYIQGSFPDFCNGTFLHNINYAMSGASNKPEGFWLSWITKTSATPLILFFGYALARKKSITLDLFCLFATVALVSMAFLIPGHGYPHYYTTYVPCIVIALILCFMMKAQTLVSISSIGLLVVPYFKGAISLVSCGLICIFFPGHPTEKQLQLESGGDFRKIITEDNLDKVLALDTTADIYLYTHATPAYKYFILQNLHSQTSPGLVEELNALFSSTNSPKYVILNHSPDGKETEIRNLSYERVKAALTSRYERVAWGKMKPNGRSQAYSLYQKID